MLTCDSNGQFNIAHYTDLHIAFPNGEPDKRTLNDFKHSLKNLESDLIILTGDQVWCYGDLAPEAGYRQIIDCLNETAIPVIVTYGNHDAEHGKLSRTRLRELERLLLHRASPTDSYLANERLSEYYPIYDETGSVVIKQLLVLDSGDYLADEEAARFSEGTTNYAYLYPEQVEWVDRVIQSDKGEALLFMHIPLEEYNNSKQSITTGTVGEPIGASPINSGLFARLFRKNVPCAVFCGHDHDNTFTSTYLGVQLNYGLISGYNVYGPEKRGYRHICLHQDKPLQTDLVYYQ